MIASTHFEADCLSVYAIYLYESTLYKWLNEVYSGIEELKLVSDDLKDLRIKLRVLIICFYFDVK